MSRGDRTCVWVPGSVDEQEKRANRSDDQEQSGGDAE